MIKPTISIPSLITLRTSPEPSLATVERTPSSDSFSSANDHLTENFSFEAPFMGFPGPSRSEQGRVYYPRLGEWTPVAPGALCYPEPESGVRPIVDSVAYGQPVKCEIDGKVVKGIFEGWDYKERPRILTRRGTRVGEWKNLTVTGEVRKVPVARPYQSLGPDKILRPPERLNKVLKRALDQRVTGTHTAKEYLAALEKEGYPMYVVGGAIRDAVHLLNENPSASDEAIFDLMKDIDIVTTASPAVLRRIAKTVAPEHDGAVFSTPVVDQFGCVLVGGPKAGLPDSAGIDLVSIRRGTTGPKPVYNRDTGEKVMDTNLGYRLKEDVLGRDFTCNALYYDPKNEVIVDPTGTGVADAQNNVLRFVDSSQALNIDRLFRYYKFKLRGCESDSFDKALVRECAMEVLPKESASNLIRIISRSAPKEIATVTEANAYLQEFKKVMVADGNGEIFATCIEPLGPKIAAEIVKKHEAPPAAADHWTAALIGAGIGITGWVATTYFKDEVIAAIEPVVSPLVDPMTQQVEDRVNAYGDRFTARTGISLPKFSLGSWF